MSRNRRGNRSELDENKTTVTWDEVHKKEARGQNNLDLGEVHEVGPTFVHTIKGVGSKTSFFIPKALVEGFDGHKLWFNVTETQVNQFIRDSPPSDTEYRTRYNVSSVNPNFEQSIPVIEEPKDGRIVTPAVGGLEETFGNSPRRASTPGGGLGENVTPTGSTTPGSQSLSREDLKRPRKDENEY